MLLRTTTQEFIGAWKQQAGPGQQEGRFWSKKTYPTLRRVPYSEQLIAEQSNLDMFGTVMELDIIQGSVVAHDREKTQQIIDALQEKVNEEQEEDVCRPGM